MANRYLEILADWNFWGQGIDVGIKRKSYVDKLLRLSSMEEVVAISGVRRSGKSTMLRQLIAELHKKNNVPFVNTLHINFEDPRLGESLTAIDLFSLYDEYQKKLKPNGKVFVFLDEVQKVTGWEKFVRTFYDLKKNVKFFVTGSNSTVFSSQLATVLTGRMIDILVYPLSYSEYKDFVNGNLDEYLRFGGFPRVVLEKNERVKKEILVSYYNAILDNDVIARNNIKNKKKLRQLALYLLSNAGNLVSSYALEKILGLSDSEIDRYLEYLEEGFLISRISVFSYSVKKQIYNPDKLFCVDTGLVNAAGFNFSENKGRLLEHVVFNKLIQEREQIFYWKNATEIDFIRFSNQKVRELINVTQTVDDPEVLERELQSLKRGSKEFPEAKLRLLTLYNQSHQKDPVIHSLSDFLLG